MVKRYVLFFVVALYEWIGWSQVSRLYSTQNGLKSSALYQTKFDSEGVAWLAGVGTLQRFDGTSFANVLSQPGELAHAVFQDVVEWGDDCCWLVTNHGLYLYNKRTNGLKHIQLSREYEGDGQAIPLNRMIRYPKEGYALITTSGFGLFVFDMTSQCVDSVLTQRLSACVDARMFRDIYIDDEERLWGSAVQNNLFCVDLKTMHRVKLSMTTDAARIVSQSSVSDICQLRESHNMVFATNAGVLIYDRKADVVRDVKSDPMTVSKVFETADGTVLLGTDGSGMWELNVKSEEVLTPFRMNDSNIDMMYAKIRSIDEDNEGNLLISIYQKGILVIPNSKDNFAYHAISPTDGGANRACITSIAADSRGRFWIATDGCGVMQSDGANLNAVRQLADGLRSKAVQAVVVTPSPSGEVGKEAVWVGSFGGGVQCLQGERFVTPDWLQPLANTYVMTMAYDAKRNLMYVGTNGKGVYMLDMERQQIVSLSPFGDFNSWTVSAYCDADGVLWCGTVSGAFRFNPDAQVLTPLSFIEENHLSTKCFASDGRSMLVGTIAGLYRYDPANGETQLLLPERDILSIETTETDIWVATSTEIIRLDKSTYTPHVFTSFGGYYLGEFHIHASYQSPTHDIYYGADNGIISFNAGHIKQQKQLKNTIYITSLKVNGKECYYQEASDENMMDANILYSSRISVPHDKNSLAFTFGVPNYSSPNRIFYRYRLEGYDNDWHQVAASHEAYYSSLPSGTYQLRIQAYYETNEAQVVEKLLKIEVGYPWYATWWAWLMYLTAIGLLAYYIYITYRARRRQKWLLTQARHNEQIKEEKLNMFVSITHEMRSPLTMIVSPLRQLMMNENQNDNENEKKSDKRRKSESSSTCGPKKMNVLAEQEQRQSLYRIMNLNCERLLNIVTQVTDIRRLDSGQFRLHFSEVDFYEYSDNIFKSFTGQAISKHISFVIEHANHNVKVWIDKVHFEKILTNLLSNAFKFTPDGGRVIVRTRCILKDAKDWYEIRVFNSGSSIAPEDIPHIFERFYQAHQEKTVKMGSGIGLNLVAELVSLHHGTVTVSNVNPDGVEFVMQIPLGNAHLSSDELQSRTDANPAEPEHYELESFTTEDDDETKDGKTRTVLVVDDDTNLCDYVKEILKDHYHVMLAYDGNSAWQQILTQRPDAIVTDIQMPECDGIELCKRVRTNPDTDNLPLIILTSESSDKTKIYSLNLDVDHFINKPFNPLMLKSAIAHSIRVRERMMSRLRRTEVGFDYDATTIDDPDEKMFNKIIQTIKAHIDDTSFGVNELAREVGVSTVHLNRKMKERYGTTPNSFIRSYRLKQSAYLLVNNNVSVSDVAYRMGFSSHPYFSSAFREYFGMSPKEFIACYADNANEDTLKKLLE